VRLFVALEPDPGTRARLASWRDRLVAERDELRPVREEALHMTLVFLGWQAEKDVESIAQASVGSVAGLPAARVEPVAVKPVPPRRPRLFALDLSDEGGRAAAIQSAVESAVTDGGWHVPEKRPFWPHMTLARVKRDRRSGPLEARALPGAFDVADVTLFRSTLLPQGARYDVLASARLAA
jgi:2'-5' RNA ligase